MTEHHLAVSGVGCLSAAGPTLERALQTLAAPPADPGPVSRLELEPNRSHPFFSIPDDFLTPEIRSLKLPLTHRYALAAAGQALDDAGYGSPLSRAGKSIGVCCGTTIGATLNDEAFYREFKAGRRPPITPLRNFLALNPAEVIARHFACKGPRLTITNACTSGADAIAMGADWLDAGICDLVLAGGSDELSRITSNGFISLSICSSRPCRPFDRDRDGLNLGEGAAFLLLEKAAATTKARARLAGHASAGDAWHLTAPEPEGRGLRQALERALGGVRAAELAFIHAHGTGTPNNDLVEGRVLTELFPDRPFFSTKRHTGHTLGAAGALGAAFSIGFLQAGILPPSAGFNHLDPAIGRAPNLDARPLQGRLALSQALGFGGNNTVLLFAPGGNQP